MKDSFHILSHSPVFLLYESMQNIIQCTRFFLRPQNTHTVKATTKQQGTPNTTKQTSLILCQISISHSNHLYVSCENHAGTHSNTQLVDPDPNTNLT